MAVLTDCMLKLGLYAVIACTLRLGCDRLVPVLLSMHPGQLTLRQIGPAAACCQ